MGQDFPGVRWLHAPSLWDVNPVYTLLEMFPRCSLLVGRAILVLDASLGERGVGCREEGWVGKAGSSMSEHRGGRGMEKSVWQRRTGGLEWAKEGLKIRRRAQPREQSTLDLFRPSWHHMEPSQRGGCTVGDPEPPGKQ